jgi:Mrp family chromosome partitioning ATPase
MLETFRLLALNVARLLEQDNPSVAIVSAWPKDGRSLVAASLARALCEIQPPVVLIDADQAGSGIGPESHGTGSNIRKDSNRVSADGDRPSIVLAGSRVGQGRQEFIQEVLETVTAGVSITTVARSRLRQGRAT